jgi:hypothetical protein
VDAISVEWFVDEQQTTSQAYLMKMLAFAYTVINILMKIRHICDHFY